MSACTRNALCALSAIATLAGVARAQAPGDDARAAARAHVAQGDAYYHTKAYDLALAEFLAAYELIPAAWLHYNIGLAYDGLGQKQEALDHFRQYIAAEPNGDRAVEAKARIVSLEREIADAQRTRDRQRAAGDAAGDGRAKAAAGDHAAAAQAFAQAFDLSGDPELLFDIADAHRNAGDAHLAIGYYERYLAEAPRGARRGHARKHIAELEAALRATPPPTGLPPPPAPQPDQPKSKSWFHPDWRWIAAGAGLIAVGVVVDLVPASSDNRELDFVDFVPAGLYVAGGAVVLVGVF